MRPSNTALAALTVAGNALAQTSNSGSTTQGEITVHTVTVAKTPYAFDPQTVFAIPGDIITFEFWSGNHSIIRAEYGYPCIPYEDVVGDAGFFSGFEPVSEGVIFTWNLTVNSTSPVFYYCGAPGSCIGHGMLGVINPDASVSLNTQLELATQSDYMIEPGQALPDEAKQSLSSLAELATTATVTIMASQTSSPVLTTASPTVTPTASATPLPAAASSSLSHGAIAGIAVGAAAFALIVAALFFFLGRTKSMQDELGRLRGRTDPPSGGAAVPAHQSWVGEKHASTISQLPAYQSPDMQQQGYAHMPEGGHPGFGGWYADPGMKDGLAGGLVRTQHRSFSSDTSGLGVPQAMQSPQEMPSIYESPAPHSMERRPLIE
ncbi:hypothetical protein LTR27_002230 [Elasticomyces elasticus]|nr:hypothetical protein LTR27_002230 [Elasticomyces elasticus]